MDALGRHRLGPHLRRASVIALVLVTLLAGLVSPHGTGGPSPRSPSPQFTTQSNDSGLSSPGSGPTVASFGTWPEYDQNSGRTGTQLLEQTLASNNASLIRTVWTYPFSTLPGNPQGIAGSVAVVDGTILFGDLGGNLYDLNTQNASTLRQVWRADTTNSVALNCPGTPSGIVSTPALFTWGGVSVVIVGTGDATGAQSYGWLRGYQPYGAHAGTSAWPNGGDNLTRYGSGPWKGAYTYSSPGIWNEYAYEGLASACNSPVIQGQLFRVEGQNGDVLNVFSVTPPGTVGGGIRSSPAIDGNNSTVWITTGSQGPNQPYEPYADSLIEVTPQSYPYTNFTVLGWAREAGSGGFSAGPTLLSNVQGTPLVVTLDTSGYAYAFNRSNFTGNRSPSGSVMGWLWEKYVGGPTYGAVAPAAFGGGRIYLAGGPVSGSSGSIFALSPTGTAIWHVGVNGYVRAGVTYANGLVIAAAISNSSNTSSLTVLNAATGRLLYEYNVTGEISGEPAVADGRIYFGTATYNSTTGGFSGSGRLYALNIPLKAQPLYNFLIPTQQIGPVFNFTGAAIGGSPPYSCAWKFGTVGTANVCGAVSFQPTQSGAYTVTLNVTDAVGNFSSVSTSLFAYFSACQWGPHKPCPVWAGGGNIVQGPCSPGSPLNCTQPLVVSFESYDTGGTGSYTYLWNFGDGHTSTIASPIHTYANSGRYVVTLTVTDSSVEQGSMQFTISVP